MPILVLVAQWDQNIHVLIARKEGKHVLQVGGLELSDNKGSSGWFHIKNSSSGTMGHPCQFWCLLHNVIMIIHVHITRKESKNVLQVDGLEPSDNRGSSGWFYI